MKGLYIAYKYLGNEEHDIKPYESYIIYYVTDEEYKNNLIKQETLLKIYEDMRDIVSSYTNTDVYNKDIIILNMIGTFTDE